MRRSATLYLGGGLLLAALGGAGWLVRGAEIGAAPRTSGETTAARIADGDPRQRQVFELIRKKEDPKAWQELVALYGKLAGDPSALGVRATVLNALFNEPSLPLRLKRVLDAIDADPTPPRQDPLWPDISQRLAQQWSGDVFHKGRDLMLMEKRARPQRALIDSFADLAAAEQGAGLPAEHARALLTDLIDMHGKADPEQRPKIQEAVRKLGGNDPADLLAGRGINDGTKLEIQAEYERNLQAGIDTLLKDAPSTD